MEIETEFNRLYKLYGPPIKPSGKNLFIRRIFPEKEKKAINHETKFTKSRLRVLQ